MTEGTLQVLGGVSMASFYGALVADYIMTVKGLAKGMKEVGLINKYVVAKWGVEGLPLSVFIEAAAVTAIFGAFASQGGVYGLVYAGTLLAAEAINDLRSAKLLGYL
jgi:hypothetical protein